jgi:hypothetical protein
MTEPITEISLVVRRGDHLEVTDWDESALLFEGSRKRAAERLRELADEVEKEDSHERP